MPKLHIWHRYVGITAALFVIVLSVTGLLLNFNDDLDLDESFASNGWLLSRYNISEFSVTSFQLQSRVVSQASDYLYIDGQYIMHMLDNVVGAMDLEDHILLATTSSLIVVDQNGEMFDEVGSYSGLPEKPLGIAKTKQGFPVLRGVNTYWLGNKELTAWQPLQGPHPKWIAPSPTPEELNQLIQTHARSNEISLERIILDLHSGRLLGQWGQHVMSAAAVLLIFLSVTGTLIWWKKK